MDIWCTGRSAEARTASPPSSFTAAQAPDVPRVCVDTSTPARTESCCSTSADAAGACHTPATRPVDLTTNTTPHLLADIELLRRQLGIERWLVFGWSWGSTLGLAYAERHPNRVSEIVLAGITAGRRREIEWITRGVGRLFPEQWARFRDGVPEADREGDLVGAYSRLLHEPDPAVRAKAASDWCDWEDAHVRVRPDHRHDPRYDDPMFRMAFARLVTHYWRHDAWLEDGVLLREAGRLASTPGVLVHGRLDLSSPLETAWELARAWPRSELIVVDEAGHSSGDPGMTEALVAATDRFANRP